MALVVFGGLVPMHIEQKPWVRKFWVLCLIATWVQQMNCRSGAKKALFFNNRAPKSSNF